MSFMRRVAGSLPAILMLSGFAGPASGQEKPIDPDSLTGGATGRFGLVINAFAAGNFNYDFNTDQNSFESSALAVSLFRALSDRVSFFGQVTVHKEESSPFVEAASPARIRPQARIIHERLQPSRGSRGFRGRHGPPAHGRSPDTSSDLLCDAPGIAVVGLPRPDEKSLAGTRCTTALLNLGARDRASLNDLHVFRLGVRELSELASRRVAEEDRGSSFSTDIENLQVSWAADPRRGLSIVFGKFDSPLAIERDDAPLNFQATSSFVFSFARPVKFAGLMARQTFSPKFEGYAILANGWDVDSDNNHAKTGALYGIWSPWPIAHFGLGVIHGAEKDGSTGDPRTTGVATILVQQTDSWVWGEEFVYGSEPHSAEDGGTAKWYGDMFFTHHRLGRHWALTLRADYLDDVGGSRTGRRQVLRSFTLSPQYLIGGGFFGVYRTLDRTSLRIPEVAVRLDLRFDRSTERVFASKTDEARRDNRSATLQIVYVF